MKITNSQVIFDSSDNPVKANLSPEIQAMLPESYQGTNTSEILADVYSAQLLAGRTVDELSVVGIDNAPDLIDNMAVTKLIATRFGFADEVEKNDFVSLFYTLDENVDFNNVDNSYYVAQLYSTVKPLVASNSIGSTVRHLYGLKRGRDNNGRVPVGEIRKFILLNRALRSEGVVLTATEVFYCSINWAETDVFRLLETGLSLSESLRLHELGFKTIDEIVEYSGGIPEDWINLILG